MNATLPRIGRAFALALAGLMLQAAVYAEPRLFAVLSLTGDTFTLVQPQMTTGSSLDRNQRTIVKVPNDSLDIAAVQAAEVALKTADRNTQVDLFVTADPQLYALQTLSDDSPETLATRARLLKAVVGGTRAKQLILITKHRGDAQFPVSDGMIGIGRVEGLGFYVDLNYELHNKETGVQSRGFVAPYAFVRIHLIDIATMRTLRTASIHESSVLPAPVQQKENAWEHLTPQQKMDALRTELQAAVDQGLRQLMADAAH
ncbi:hypothetical protein [Piscinibacter terrae]|uniref:Uncharacterized protein n=1 Tax=Piscinibacter terrae TaxID=2496871 RepID=A0A3N7HPK6_9BURK|nr:hypothetical protein [Albitalea terrae]RQP24094.1 hypothetical protein DZC73_12235 [Albitalea terrae]